MRKQRVLFLCTQNSARSQMAEGFLREMAGDRFEVHGAGIDPTDEVHPCAVEAMSEVGIDISDQYPKGLRTYLGKMGFNYLIIVCARAEKRCPKTFPGVGTRLVWPFEDPRRDEEIPYDSMLERFRKVRDEIELKIKDWLEHPEEELAKLRAEREREREERLRAARRAREQRTELEALLQRPQRSHSTSAAETRHASLLGTGEHPLGGLAEQRAGCLPVDGVEAPLPSPLLAHQPRVLELPHVVGDLGLAHAEDPLELADADALVSLVRRYARVREVAAVTSVGHHAEHLHPYGIGESAAQGD